MSWFTDIYGLIIHNYILCGNDIKPYLHRKKGVTLFSYAMQTVLGIATGFGNIYSVVLQG